MKRLKYVLLFENFEWKHEVDDLADLMRAGLMDHGQYSSLVKDMIRKQGYDLGQLLEVQAAVGLEPATIQSLIAEAVTTENTAAIRYDQRATAFTVAKKGEPLSEPAKQYSLIHTYSGGNEMDHYAVTKGDEREAIQELSQSLASSGFRYVYVRTGYHQPDAYIIDTQTGKRGTISIYSTIKELDQKMGIEKNVEVHKGV